MRMPRTLNRAVVKLNGATRLLMTRTMSSLLPLYVVTEYPRSGGTWFGQMLAEYLRLPFPRNRFPVLRSSVMHGHYMHFPGIQNVCVVLRDGRDVTVSFYYHSLFRNERFNRDLVDITRRNLGFRDYSDIVTNLPHFIDYLFNHNRHPRFNWSQFVNSWLGKRAVFVKYEDLLEDTVGTLGRAVRGLTGEPPDRDRLVTIADQLSFSRQSGRRQGRENIGSFLRKGVAGDWRRRFNREARELFNELAGAELQRLAYENDDSWVDEPRLEADEPAPRSDST